MQKRIRLTEAELNRLIAESVNKALREGAFTQGFKDGYGKGAIQNWNSGETTYDQSVQGQGYFTPNDKNNPKQQQFTKKNAIKNRIGGALGAMAGGRMPKGTFKGMNWSQKNGAQNKTLNEIQQNNAQWGNNTQQNVSAQGKWGNNYERDMLSKDIATIAHLSQQYTQGDDSKLSTLYWMCLGFLRKYNEMTKWQYKQPSAWGQYS